VVWLFGERISDAGGDGADRVVSDPAFGIGAYDLGRVLAIVGGCEQSIAPRAIIFPDTLLGREAAARLAALHGEHAIAYSEGAEFLHRDVRILVVEPDWIAPPQNIEICEGRTMDPAFVVVPVLPEQIGSITREPSQTMPLEEAPLVLCVGQGVTDFEAAIRAAARMGAALGGTRPVCDAGRLDRSRQIGASGRRATPDLYMAFGVSGAPQHLEGVTGAARVVAVNTDATAPMMARADVAIVADAGAVILELDRLVQRPS
jgi:electron transfer flavoprotein alpha subunit